MNGTFEELEETVVPFKLGNQEFNKLYVLVNRIYTQYSQFMKSIAEPAGPAQESFTTFQEKARKM